MLIETELGACRFHPTCISLETIRVAAIHAGELWRCHICMKQEQVSSIAFLDRNDNTCTGLVCDSTYSLVVGTILYLTILTSLTVPGTSLVCFLSPSIDSRGFITIMHRSAGYYKLASIFPSHPSKRTELERRAPKSTVSLLFYNTCYVVNARVIEHTAT